ncbi:MAG: hypothetical protein IJ362_06765 [Oscillospiraceae bacterium]|nr:hypothetical protein [Oscillospiraceae bacterium]
MKKIIALLISLSVLLSFTACGGRSQQEDTPKEPQVQLVRGNYNEDKTVFTNESMGITVNVPQDWYIFSDNDIAEWFLDGVTGDEYSAWTQEDFAQQITIPDMAMQDLFTGANINLQYENLDVSANGLDIDEEHYAKLSQKQLNGLGFNYEYSDLNDVQLNGQDYKWFSATGSNDGLTFTQYFIMRRVDNYMVVFVTTSYEDHDVQFFFDMFR